MLCIKIMSIGILSTKAVSNSQKSLLILLFKVQKRLLYIFLEDIPHQVTSHNNDFFVTTRSFRWPYAGWIVGLQEENEMFVEKELVKPLPSQNIYCTMTITSTGVPNNL